MLQCLVAVAEEWETWDQTQEEQEYGGQRTLPGRRCCRGDVGALMEALEECHIVLHEWQAEPGLGSGGRRH